VRETPNASLFAGKIEFWLRRARGSVVVDVGACLTDDVDHAIEFVCGAPHASFFAGKIEIRLLRARGFVVVDVRARLTYDIDHRVGFVFFTKPWFLSR
jgi:hypothetical protein